MFVALFACDLNDDGGSRSSVPAPMSHGTLSPRFQAASGVLAEADSIHLKLRIVDGSSGPDPVVSAYLFPLNEAFRATGRRLPSSCNAFASPISRSDA